MPPNGDTTQLPPDLQLKWADLPRRDSPTLASGAQDGMSRGVHMSDTLENPPVNPITGPGRTACDVARELNSYQNFLRRTARAGSGQCAAAAFPIFQSDYLLVRQEHELVLHRVAHGMMIEDATSEDVSFTTTEYAHTPLPGVRGLFGTFVPKVCSVCRL